MRRTPGVGTWTIRDDPHHWDVVMGRTWSVIFSDCGPPDDEEEKANADFIANAPDDVEYLLGKVSRLQAVIRDLDLPCCAVDHARVCNQPGCHAANVKRDNGNVECAMGHDTRWCEVTRAEEAEARAAELKSALHDEKLRGLVMRLLLRQNSPLDKLTKRVKKYYRYIDESGVTRILRGLQDEALVGITPRGKYQVLSIAEPCP